MVLLEAMAASTPIVASDLPGYTNVARHGIEAMLVPRGEARALANAVVRVMGDSSLASALVAGGEARAAEFAMDRLADRYAGLYQHALAMRPARERGRSGLEVHHHA
jgi:glycosyltransferase involved in cell wall biosynthesis